ncbi:uncharacterized protein TrAtP1_013195 [Trichoderma atroviride]|uniref:uncharacterized protein n=1 Tax=Hypocrea atroviridis TaxID=63577 RepID=UPI00332A5572|nr:hypothetical protein TrAtP1_013195 [Trichoderma atroviride]
MAYNPYGGTQHRGRSHARYASANGLPAPHNPYGAPPGYGYPGAAPGMAAPPGLGMLLSSPASRIQATGC